MLNIYSLKSRNRDFETRYQGVLGLSALLCSADYDSPSFINKVIDLLSLRVDDHETIKRAVLFYYYYYKSPQNNFYFINN